MSDPVHLKIIRALNKALVDMKVPLDNLHEKVDITVDNEKFHCQRQPPTLLSTEKPPEPKPLTTGCCEYNHSQGWCLTCLENWLDVDQLVLGREQHRPALDPAGYGGTYYGEPHAPSITDADIKVMCDYRAVMERLRLPFLQKDTKVCKVNVSGLTSYHYRNKEWDDNWDIDMCGEFCCLSLFYPKFQTALREQGYNLVDWTESDTFIIDLNPEVFHDEH